ncbi:hypothetical protein B0H21DRAFT_737818 [Amylocystis lapponica]|nr:hypothetical protein B0H21DRAFT_737818 [Amylocystis lapponica]
MSTPERDAQLLSIGQQCSASSCLLVDFLPFKCQHCAHSFCRDHFLPESHKCEKFDASKHNRVAPSCPLCNTPVAIPLGQDPNIRMEAHIASECSVMTGKSGKASSSPTCAKVKCGKVLFAPIQCGKCKQQFCPQHRFPNDHACVSITAAKSSPGAAKALADVSAQTSAASAAAMAAIRRAMASTTISSASMSSSAASHTPPQMAQPPLIAKSSSSSSSRQNPFSPTDRRAKAERESRRRAIQDRARKGLALSEEEKAILAEGEAKDECAVM